jgi:hypothetical protein
MNLDDDLRRALKRQPPPSDFADRVLARIARGDAEGGRLKGARGREGSPALRWLAAAAALALGLAGAVRYSAYQQTVAEAERVKAEIRLALQITSEKIAMVQVRLKPDVTYERAGRNP